MLRKNGMMMLLMILLCLFLGGSFLAYGFTNTNGLGNRESQVDKEGKPLDLQQAKDLRVEIKGYAEVIQLRIVKVKRNIVRLLNRPGDLSDDQINSLKEQAIVLKSANEEIKEGLESMKGSFGKLKGCLEEKDRKGALISYKQLIGQQRAHLRTLKQINEQLLLGMDKLLEINVTQ